jgi:hypothetical protein
MILKTGQAVEGTVLLSSVTWKNPGTGVATVRDRKGTVITELSAKDPAIFFAPVKQVTGLSVEMSAGELEVQTLKLTAQMAAVLQLPAGTAQSVIR